MIRDQFLYVMLDISGKEMPVGALEQRLKLPIFLFRGKGVPFIKYLPRMFTVPLNVPSWQHEFLQT
jgi:hypothetical protein